MADTIDFEYLFTFADGRKKSFQVMLDAQTLELVGGGRGPYPGWTDLSFQQCANCPLRPESQRSCPAAVTLLSVVEFFSDMVSYDQVGVTVTTPERKISVQTSVQRALGSLMGLLMPASGCPRMTLFRPMARFHLPFSSQEETIYRAASMYLLGQYFQHKRGKDVDLDFVGLLAYYREVELVNRSVTKRLLAASANDASANAVILLDLFAKALPSAIEDSLEELRHLFGFLDQDEACPAGEAQR